MIIRLPDWGKTVTDKARARGNKAGSFLMTVELLHSRIGPGRVAKNNAKPDRLNRLLGFCVSTSRTEVGIQSVP